MFNVSLFFFENIVIPFYPDFMFLKRLLKSMFMAGILLAFRLIPENVCSVLAF